MHNTRVQTRLHKTTAPEPYARLRSFTLSRRPFETTEPGFLTDPRYDPRYSARFADLMIAAYTLAAVSINGADITPKAVAGDALVFPRHPRFGR
jgi:hypothetical protein